MGTLAPQKMTVDEFLAWAEEREGRWELYNGVPNRMGWIPWAIARLEWQPRQL